MKDRKAEKDTMVESSFVFSLDELRRMEQERVAAEKAAVAAREEDNRRAAEQLEATRRELDARRQAAEEEERRAAEWREREARAREVAIERAALESARAGAEAKARADEARALHAQTLELAQVRDRGEARRARRALTIAVAASVLVVAGLFGIYAGVVSPAHARALAVLSADVGSRDASLRELTAKVEDQRGRLDRAERDLADARRDVERRRTEAPRPCQPQAPAVPRGPAGTIVPRGPELNFAKCAPGSRDPLCVQ